MFFLKKLNFIIALNAALTIGATFAQNLQIPLSIINKELKEAGEQIKILAEQTPIDKFPKTFEDKNQVFSSSSWWCSGFYPGTLLYLYEGTGDKQLLDEAQKKLTYLDKEKYNKSTHDLGFMLYCSFGNALRLTGDSTLYKEVLTTGVESLASRYSNTQKAIKSWSWGTWNYAVIIDNMMNLEFLTQLSRITGDQKYRDIAVSHANTTLKNHFRKNYSSYHVVDYDKNSGQVLAKKTHQGAADESAWARGQGWALYGYTMMFRETKDKAYLKRAQKVADFILSHPNLPQDLIPYWDFDMDKIGIESDMYKLRDLRDVSAATLYASALLELSQYVSTKKRKTYLAKAETILINLSKDPYKSAYGDNGGYLLKHSVGALPLKSEVDVPLTYADYYYAEALVRYKRLLENGPVVKGL